MGGTSCKGPASDGKPITIAILGLDNAGKTTTARALERETVDGVTPTIGYSKSEIDHGKEKIHLIDLGGGKNFRDAWRHYYDDAYGFVYVIDSSEPERMVENREVLKKLLQEEKVKGKPILILANKQDKEDALEKNKILEDLRIQRLVNDSQSVCLVKSCSATSIRGKGKNMKIDEEIRHGFNWLIKTIYENRDSLSKRVEKDLQERKEKEEREKRERKERIQKLREEREKEEGGKKEDDDDDEGGPTGFVPIGQAVKNAERNNPEKSNKTKKNRDDENFRPIPAPRSSSHSRKPLPNSSNDSEEERPRRHSFDRSARVEESPRIPPPPPPPRSQSSRFDDDDDQSIHSNDDPTLTRPTLGKKKKLIGPTRTRTNGDTLPPLAPSSAASRREDFPLHKGPPTGTPRPSGLVAQWAITSPTPHQHPGAEKLTSIASDNELDTTADDDQSRRPKAPPRIHSPHANAKNRIKHDKVKSPLATNHDDNADEPKISSRKARSRFDDDDNDDQTNNERIHSSSRQNRKFAVDDDDDELR